MSAFLGAHVRHHPPYSRRHIGLLAIPLALTTVAIGVASADLPPGVIRISAGDAARAGVSIRLVRHAVASSGTMLLEVQSGETAPASPDGTARLLAVSSDGAQVALADQVGELFGSLTIGRADGSQLRVQLPGLLAAGFAANGSWLAVIDGRGALWQLDIDSGRLAQLADGPFVGTPIASEDGSLMLLSVPSVQAPYRSELVRLTPSTGVATLLASDHLVYGAFPLADGSVAVVAHESGRTVVRNVSTSGSRMVANLGSGAVNVAVAPDARHIAFERTGGVFMVDGPGGAARSLGTGSAPCFAADGSWLLVRQGSRNVALALDGSVLAVTDLLAAPVGSAGCLP
ncbi:MAG: hypothetical protein ABI978_00585 [Chloroflexota bacterium]